MRKDFKNLDIYAAFQPVDGAEWQKANGIHADWKTPEHIEVKPVYTKEDLEGMEHLDYAAGIPPYLRGPYSMMYTFRPWTIPSVCRILHGRGIQRFLSPQPGFRPKRFVGCFRPAHAPRL